MGQLIQQQLKTSIGYILKARTLKLSPFSLLSIQQRNFRNNFTTQQEAHPWP
jgi:hypothetical protein